MLRQPAQRLDIVVVSQVETQDIQWLWPGWIPLGKLTVLEGDPGLGKSTLLCDLAARASAGRSMPAPGQAVAASDVPGDTVEELLTLVQTPGSLAAVAEPMPAAPAQPALTGPADVVLLTAEDAAGDTVRPRLEAAGADLDRIHLITGARDTGDETARPPVFPLDLRPLEETLTATQSRLLIVDPLAAYLGAEINTYSDADVRRCLDRLARLAQRQACAIILLRHLNKKARAPALYRGGGSIGIIASARSALRVARDPDRLPPSATEPLHGVLACPKCNLGAPPMSLRYTLRPTSRAGICRVDWDGWSHLSAEDLDQPSNPAERSVLHAAVEFLREFLRDGPQRSPDCQLAALTQGISDATLRRAKETLGVQSVHDGKNHCWSWQLPYNPSTNPSERMRSVHCRLDSDEGYRDSS